MMSYLEDITDPFAYETITVATIAVGFTAGTYSPTNARAAQRAALTLETAQIRWRADGTAPTSTEGHLMEVGDEITLEGIATIGNFKAIRTGATSGVLKVTFER